MTAARRAAGTRERKKRDKLNRLRKAAWELFTSVGYNETTTLAVAQRAGVAAGTVFLYAKDKPDLLFLVLEHRLARTLDAAFRTVPAEAPLTEQLRHVFARLFALYERIPDIGRQFVKELPGADGPNARRVSALTFGFLQRLAGLVEAAQRRGEVRPDVAPLIAAQSAFALYFMALFTWLSGATSLRASLETFLRPALDLLGRGLADAGRSGGKPG